MTVRGGNDGEGGGNDGEGGGKGGVKKGGFMGAAVFRFRLDLKTGHPKLGEI